MVDHLKSYFPYPKYREYQRETIISVIKAFANGYDNVVLEAPTGSGKSVIAMTVGAAFGSMYYLTIQKILQEQLMKDFGGDHGNLVDLRGRNAYRCWLDGQMNPDSEYKVYAHRGRCARAGKSKLPQCAGKCFYYKQIALCDNAPYSLFNFSSFLFQRTMAKRFTDTRKLLVIDECHQVESQIMDFVETRINGNDFDIKIPEFDTTEQYMAYFDAVELSNKILEKLNQFNGMTELSSDDIREKEKWESISSRYYALRNYARKIDCVPELSDNIVKIKPLRSHYHAPKLLFNAGEKRLLMSATVLNHKVYASSIGLDLSKTKYIRLPSTFPTKNRPIILDYAGSMKFANRKSTMPSMIDKINSIMEQHHAHKGIIHTQSFQIMYDIIDGLKEQNAQRIIHQRMYPRREDLIDVHARSNNTVIIAPAMHEGLDLKDDLSRFQVIVKVPYADTSRNKQLQIRTKESWGYYLWLAALKLCQSYGRSIRSESDWATTYILDSDFDKFFNQCDSMRLLPDWFISAIQID
ncbi:MAG: hypothetical protein GF411_14340 [Candidatus Lokiarchaeota archaeon]|nr:hypothetical protein [Candidatus Lokiarchaeota archaeon]